MIIRSFARGADTKALIAETLNKARPRSNIFRPRRMKTKRLALDTHFILERSGMSRIVKTQPVFPILV